MTNYEWLRARLKLKNIQNEKILSKHHPHTFFKLKNLKLDPSNFRKYTLTALSAPITALSLFTSPILLPAITDAQVEYNTTNKQQDLSISFEEKIQSLVPKNVADLSSEQEIEISKLIKNNFGINAYPELDGNRLNHQYGLIGAEQHLPRYPGDTAEEHGQYIRSGITPGRGAWGYFARSKQELTPELVAIERYYVAVQTLYLPDWSARLSYLRDWYKYRKVVVINPQNGKTVIASIADAGPASWTGKHFGGSPEIMAYLGLNVGKQKGAVILFFVDDQNGIIPLGPLENNLLKPNFIQG